jgi:hypothetical protein
MALAGPPAMLTSLLQVRLLSAFLPDSDEATLRLLIAKLNALGAALEESLSLADVRAAFRAVVMEQSRAPVRPARSPLHL